MSTRIADHHVLLGVCGGIAAYKAPELVRRLRDHGFEVRCALTPHADAFVSPLALEVVSGHAVYREEYLAPSGTGQELHIEAASWADLVLIAPATAQTLAALALGLANNFLLTTLLAHRGPVLVAPAMHAAMWEQTSVQQRVNELRARGVEVIGPAVGPLASGEIGAGRMVDVPVLVEAAAAHFRSGDLSGKRVLITAGPTYEAIDPVRFLGNRSSGKMGFALAAEAAARGAEVTLVAGPVALPTPAGVSRRIDVVSALEMEAAVRETAPQSDLVVMAAAVADFRPRMPVDEKIKKRSMVPHLDLVANPDILASLPELAPHALRVGFAAETSRLRDEAERKLLAKGAHLLVANDVSRTDIGFGSEENQVLVLRLDGEPIAFPKMSKARLAHELMDLFAEALRNTRREAVSSPG